MRPLLCNHLRLRSNRYFTTSRRAQSILQIIDEYRYAIVVQLEIKIIETMIGVEEMMLVHSRARVSKIVQ